MRLDSFDYIEYMKSRFLSYYFGIFQESGSLWHISFDIRELHLILAE